MAKRGLMGWGALSDIFFGAAWCSRAGAGDGWILGHMFVSRTGSGQHGSTHDVKQGATPGDENGGAKLKSATDKIIFCFILVK